MFWADAKAFGWNNVFGIAILAFLGSAAQLRLSCQYLSALTLVLFLPVQAPKLLSASGFAASCIGQRSDCGLRQPVAVQRSSLRMSQTMLKRRRAQGQGSTASTVGSAVSTVGRAASTVGRIVQLEIESASDTLISVRRDDGVGKTIRIAHHLTVGAGLPKALAVPRVPSDSELLQVTVHVNERLRQQGVSDDRSSLLQWLKDAISALGAPATSAASPLGQRDAASTRSKELGGAYGQIYCTRDYWRWTSDWQQAITCNCPRWLTAPTERELVRVHALLVLFLDARARGCAQPPPLGKEAARELLHTTLLRLQLLDPPALNLAQLLASPAPTQFWFTTRIGSAPNSIQAVLDPSLLEDERWLDANELLAETARAWLGDTVEAVLQTLRTCADLDFSNSTLVMLQHDRKPLPSPCAAQLVALAGGAPAMRYLESAIGSMGIALVLREIDPALAQDAVVMNTAAGER